MLCFYVVRYLKVSSIFFPWRNVAYLYRFLTIKEAWDQIWVWLVADDLSSFYRKYIFSFKMYPLRARYDSLKIFDCLVRLWLMSYLIIEVFTHYLFLLLGCCLKYAVTKMAKTWLALVIGYCLLFPYNKFTLIFHFSSLYDLSKGSRKILSIRILRFLMLDGFPNLKTEYQCFSFRYWISFYSMIFYCKMQGMRQRQHYPSRLI